MDEATDKLLDLIEAAFPFVACDSPLSELHERLYRALVQHGRRSPDERLEAMFAAARKDN